MVDIETKAQGIENSLMIDSLYQRRSLSIGAVEIFLEKLLDEEKCDSINCREESFLKSDSLCAWVD